MMANAITVSRILLSFVLLLFKPGETAFTLVYLSAGLTDMVDGAVARRLNTESGIGSKLDTAADICFFLAAGYKIIPGLHMPRWLLMWVLAIAALKIAGMVYGMAVHGRLITVHSALNRLTGVLLFVFPLTLSFIPKVYSVTFICAVASAAAAGEFSVIKGNKD